LQKEISLLHLVCVLLKMNYLKSLRSRKAKINSMPLSYSDKQQQNPVMELRKSTTHVVCITLVEMVGITLPKKSTKRLVSIIKAGDAASSCCSVNRPFLIHVDANSQLVHSYEVTVGVQTRRESLQGTFETIGQTNIRISEDDIEQGVLTPKIIHIPIVYNQEFSKSEPKTSKEVVDVERQRSFTKYFKGLRRSSKKVPDLLEGVEIDRGESFETRDDDDISVSTIETNCSLDQMSKSNKKRSSSKVRGVYCEKEAYVTIMLESYDQKPTNEFDAFLERIGDLFGCTPDSCSVE